MSTLLGLADEAMSPAVTGGSERKWPVVHAFNCLRHTFADGHLSTDTSGYFARGMQVRPAGKGAYASVTPAGVHWPTCPHMHVSLSAAHTAPLSA